MPSALPALCPTMSATLCPAPYALLCRPPCALHVPDHVGNDPDRIGEEKRNNAELRAVLQARMMCTYRYVFKVGIEVFKYAEYDGNIRFAAPFLCAKI